MSPSSPQQFGLLCCWIVSHDLNVPQCLYHLPIEGYLDCFHFLAIPNKASVWHKCAEVQLPGFMVSAYLVFVLFFGSFWGRVLLYSLGWPQTCNPPRNLCFLLYRYEPPHLVSCLVLKKFPSRFPEWHYCFTVPLAIYEFPWIWNEFIVSYILFRLFFLPPLPVLTF
jgi:hypothetical protein